MAKASKRAISDHTLLDNIGTNTHAQIDSHIADASIHFTESSIDHGSISGLGDDDHTQYLTEARHDALAADNPHSVTLQQSVDQAGAPAQLDLDALDSGAGRDFEINANSLTALSIAQASGVTTFGAPPTSPGGFTDSEEWGAGADAGADRCVVFGSGASSSSVSSGSTVMGYNASSSDGDEVAIGSDATVNGAGIIDSGIAIGHDSSSLVGSMAIGADTTTSFFDFALGTSAVADGLNSNAYGFLADAGALSAIAFGYTSSAQGTGSIAFGSQSGTTGNSAIAIGIFAQANATSAIGIGATANSSHGGSIALGNLALTTAANQLTIGGNGAGNQITQVVVGRRTVAPAPPTQVTWETTSGSGTNISATSYHIRPGAGTGTGAGGDFIVSTAAPGASGSSLNSYVERVRFGDNGEVVFNSSGADYDFRIAGDTDTNLFFVDASTDRVGIGTLTPAELFHVAGVLKADTRADVGDQGTETGGIDFNGTTYNTEVKISEIGGSLEAMLSIHRHSTTLPAGMITSRSNTDDSTHGAVTSDQVLWRQIHAGWTGSHYDNFAEIRALVDDSGTISSTSSPGRLQLRTTPDGSNTSTLAIDIDNAQDVDLPNGQLAIAGDTGGIASRNVFTGATDTPTTDPGWTSSSTIDMNAPDGYMKAYVGTQAVVIPYWNT